MKKENRNRFKKLSAFGLTLLVMSVLTACTGGGGNNGGAVTANNSGGAVNQGTGADKNSPATEPPAIDKSAIKGDIKVLSIFGGGAIENFNKMMVEFNKEYPNVKVTHMEQGINDLPALISAGENPDVIISDGGRFPIDWISDGLIQDMKPLMEKDSEITADMFYEPAYNRGVGVEGQLWQLPYTVDPNFTMLYNQEALEQQGESEIPELNTLPEFDEFLKKYWIVENGEQVMTTFSPFEVYGNLNSLITMAYLNGADQSSFYNAETKTATFNDPKIVEALEWMLRFKRENIDDGRIAKLNESLPANTTRFAAGKSLLEPGVVGAVRDALKVNPDVQMKPMPSESLWLGGHGIHMTTLGKKENEEAAWSLVKWISSSKAAAEIKLKTIASLSAIKDNPYLVEQAEVDPVMAVAHEILQQATKIPPFLPVPYEGEFDAKYGEVLSGKLEPKAFLDHMTKYTQALLDELKK
ncbi:extracellular solute-binding protein [Paenibacillus pasadenensis]|uniref:extracellular solute-binding protein n=1 Tax=Paenibacillus pasadenensis TaxID=217090 RepID=UPI00203C1AE0|nr:extracellular solute-binding protein [Paenibacillus pasadenensis]MCM3748788.1 extracellular solute-binding protein [Paenibacillus pasadenensis]